MSSFLVSDDCVRRVLTERVPATLRFAQRELIAEALRAEGCPLRARAVLVGHATDGDRARAMRALLVLNTLALAERYPGREHAEPEPAPWMDVRGDVPLAAQFKAAQSLRYQCAEGAAAETLLYRALDRYAQALAEELASEHPDYKAAPWG